MTTELVYIKITHVIENQAWAFYSLWKQPTSNIQLILYYYKSEKVLYGIWNVGGFFHKITTNLDAGANVPNSKGELRDYFAPVMFSGEP